MERLLIEGQEPQIPVILPHERPHTRLTEKLLKNPPSVQIILQTIRGRIHEGWSLELVPLKGVDGRELIDMFPKVAHVPLHHLKWFHSHDVGEAHFMPQLESKVHGLASVIQPERFLVSSQ